MLLHTMEQMIHKWDNIYMLLQYKQTVNIIPYIKE